MPWAADELTVELDLSIDTPVFKLPGLKIGGKWKPDEKERDAAWQMYVELVTRISIAELRPDEGILREALSSLHNLFDITRGILRAHGPAVARPKLQESHLSFGYIAVGVLNVVLRPVLARWHPLLQDWENHRSQDTSVSLHESRWPHSSELREVLNATRRVLIEYANLLQRAAAVEALIIERPTIWPE